MTKLWHSCSAVMMTPVESPSPSEPTIWSYLAEHGRFLVVLSAATITTGLGLQMTLGAYFSRPDFWDIRQLVGLGAEGIMLFAIMLATCSSLGCSGRAIIWSIHALFLLILNHLGNVTRIPPTHVRLRNREDHRRILAVQTTYVQIQARLAAQRPSLTPPSKSPFRLFRQAPLLVSP